MGGVEKVENGEFDGVNQSEILRKLTKYMFYVTRFIFNIYIAALKVTLK